MRRKIEDELIAIGIYPNLRGFDYICMIVEEIISSNMEIKKITAIYYDVAKQKNTTVAGVERAIRHAKSKCDAYAVCGYNRDLSNTEFLYILALNIEREVRER